MSPDVTNDSMANPSSPNVVSNGGENKLDPRIKNVWRINDCIWIVVIALFCIVPFLLVALIDEEDMAWANMVVLIELIALVALLILFLGILPSIRYARWRYRVSDDYLEIRKGIIWRSHYVIPFIRVQNTDTRQGPIMRMFGLSSVTVATAAGEHEIPGLRTAEAQVLRDKAAELARLAREDV